MPDNDIPERVSDAMETIKEYTGVNVKKRTAKTTRDAYATMTVVAAASLPLALPVGPVPAISQAQEQATRPEEHLPSQSQAANTVGGTGFLVVAASTSSTADFSIVKKDGMTWSFTIPSKQKPPEP